MPQKTLPARSQVNWSVIKERVKINKNHNKGNGRKKTIQDYSKELRQQIKWLDQLITATRKYLNAIKISDDRPVRSSKRKNGYQYYLQKTDGKLEYVKEKDIDKVKRIVQRDYYNALLDNLLTMRYRIEKFTKIYDIGSIARVYDNLSEARKALVTPLIPSDEAYITEWRVLHVGGTNTFPEEGKYLTARGELVRSKSEKILADMFEKFDIPYVYESQIVLPNGKCLYPDFALLNMRTRKTIYWEHFGLITDGDYARHALLKINQFDKMGIEVGKELVISMESNEIPLDIKQIEKKIKEYLL